MADNVTLSTVTSAGVPAAADDIGGIYYQRIKITLGDDGTTLGDVSPANPMPVVNSAAVTVTGSVTAAITGPVTVTGSVTSAITGPVTVTGSVTAVQSGNWSIMGPVTVTGSVTAIHSGPVTVTGTVGVTAPVSVQGNVSLAGGTTGISGPVTVTGTVAATQSGSWGIAGPVTVTGSVGVQGVTAHGTVVAGNPVLVGLNALAADQTAVTTTAVTRAVATLLGKLVAYPYALPAQSTCYAPVTAGLATTVAATAFASAGASTRWYLTSAQFINQGGAVTRVMLQDGAGAVYYTAPLATSGGGVSATFPVPLRIAANQTVEIKLDTTGTTVYANLQGFKAGE